MSSSLEIRQQIARLAAERAAGSSPAYYATRAATEAAIKSATQVQITHEVVMAFIEAPDSGDDITGPLRAAFEAAGFEVIE